MTHLLKLLDKMCKYEMDLASIVEDTEQTRFCPQTDKVKPVYRSSTSLSEGYDKACYKIMCTLFGTFRIFNQSVEASMYAI